jgi:AbrB family looped-hinge helix DNA binding protein
LTGAPSHINTYKEDGITPARNMSTTVTTKGQVTIPKKVRDFLGIRPGTAVDFEVRQGGDVVLVRADGKRRSGRLARLRGMARGGMTTDEIMRLTRGDD